MNELKSYTLDQVQNELIGKKGTPKRDKFENELHMNLTKKSIHKRYLRQEKLRKTMMCFYV